MKNASQIINSIQYKPQYKKILEHKCIARLISALMLSVQRNIKYGYFKNSILFLTISATLDKYDKDNIINTIKMILNSPMILNSDKFMECQGINIEDIKVYVDHKPKHKFKPYLSNTHNLQYFERSQGDFQIDMKDEKLQALFEEIQTIIKEKHES
jgi:hypothetical protein